MATERKLISLAEVLQDRRTIDVEFDNGIKVPVTYQPSLLTPARTKAMKDAQRSQTAEDLASLQLVLDLLVAWDLGGPLCDLAGHQIVAAGDPIPIDAETAQHLSDGVMSAIFDAVVADYNGSKDPKAKKRSGA